MHIVESPCNGTCRINIRSGLCEGCLRTEQEISEWRQMGPEQQLQLLTLIEHRRETGKRS